MPNPLTQSLIFRAGVAMAAITLLAIASMMTTMVIADTARGDAAAINQAGSLRMQAYRLAATLQESREVTGDRVGALMAELERSLHHPVLRQAVPERADHALRHAYEYARLLWEQDLKPGALTNTGDGLTGQAAARYLSRADAFADAADRLVRGIQQRAEDRVQLLRLLQGAALFLTVTLLFFIMYKMLTDVVPPLRELFQVAEAARRGNFAARASYQGQDEIGLLARTFNHMAEDLSRTYADLEQRVTDKTRALTRSNHSLALLFQTAHRLSRERGQADFHPILEQVERLIGSGPLTLCLATPEAQRAYRRITTVRSDAPGFCRAPDCADCLRGTAMSEPADVVSIPVVEGEHTYGAILVQPAPGEALADWQRELVAAVGDLIATALRLSEQEEQQRRLAMMDERAVIARELHDSLAQSLSYLKIQVTRLQTQLDRGADREQVQAVIGELREGLSSAYRELRELLSTFRLQINEAGLEPALRETVAEFSERGGLDIHLDYRLAHCPLTSSEEIHILQVVREALSNVVHHARASRADLTLATNAAGEVAVRIVDNGVGLPAQWQRKNHYGMIIMQERTESLRGRFDAHNHPDGGTEVSLTFRPEVARTAGTSLV